MVKSITEGMDIRTNLLGARELKQDYKPLTFSRIDMHGSEIPKTNQQVHKAAGF